MSHGIPANPSDLLDPAISSQVAETMHALAAPSRLRILGRLNRGACSVNQLAADVGMESSAVSHQLRVLRLLGLVASRREGRSIKYSLHDEHVGALLAEAMSHVEHLRLGRTLGVGLESPAVLEA